MNFENAKKLAVGCRELADRLDPANANLYDEYCGSVSLGRNRIRTEYGEPCCAFGHAIHAAGLMNVSGSWAINNNWAAASLLNLPNLIPAKNNKHSSLGVALIELEKANDSALPIERAAKVVEPLRQVAAELDKIINNNGVLTSLSS